MEARRPANKDTLWHQMRADLARYYSPTYHNDLLMCPMCGRQLPFEHFSVEHIIPQQALADDPQVVKDALTVNERSGNILLCSKPIRVKGQTVEPNGCNGWKGRHFDTGIRQLLNGDAIQRRTRQRSKNHHIVAALSGAFLATVFEFGYQAVLMQSGLLMRRQFFDPGRIRQELPVMCGVVLTISEQPKYDGDLTMWRNRFSFGFENEFCLVSFRTFVVRLPLSRDPRIPLAQRLNYAPSRFVLRPDFGAFFG